MLFFFMLVYGDVFDCFVVIVIFSDFVVVELAVGCFGYQVVVCF